MNDTHWKLKGRPKNGDFEFITEDQAVNGLDNMGKQIFIMLQFVIGFALPLVVIVTSYCLVVRKVRMAKLRQSHVYENRIAGRITIFVAACM